MCLWTFVYNNFNDVTNVAYVYTCCYVFLNIAWESLWIEDEILQFKELKFEFCGFLIVFHIISYPSASSVILIVNSYNLPYLLSAVYFSYLFFMNKMVGLIRRSFSYLTERMLVTLFKSLVRPILEYGHSVWQPNTKELCAEVERVQKRATKMIGHLKDKEYPERLRKLKLPSLEHRRLRGDLIEVYKYLNGHYDTEKPSFEMTKAPQLRGHSMRIQKQRGRLELRTNYFSNRVNQVWNDLPESVVTAPSTNTFKNRLDHHWRDLPTMYNPNCIN